MAVANAGGSGLAPGFCFTATLFDDVEVPFQQVDGLDTGSTAIEYRQGSSPIFSPVQMPALGTVGNATLRRGMFVNDARFWNWYDAVQMNTAAGGTVTITQLDGAGAPKTAWTLTNARVTRITGTDLAPGGGEVAVESLEIAYETLAVATP